MSGSKPGERRGGRQKGTPNKRTEVASEVRKEISARIQEQVKGLEKQVRAGASPEVALEDLMRAGNKQLAELIPKGTPLVHMLQIMHDDRQPPTFRFEAAKAAAAYLHSKTAEQPVREQEAAEIVEIRRVVVPYSPEHSDSAGIPSAPWRSEI